LYYCRKWNKPLIWTLHGAILDDAQRDVFDPQPFYIKFLKSIWLKICNEFIDPKNMVIHVTSEQELNATKNKFTKATFILIPHGVELPNLDNQYKKWKSNNSLHILYIGRLAPKKGIENLLRAVKLINIPMNLYIYGSGNIDYENKLKKLTKELNLMDKVLFMGVVDGKEKEKAFLEADICIVPSYSENFGMVVIEALSYSIPVIVSRSLSWQDIEKIGCGFSVENDPLNLAKAIEIAYQSPLEEMGKKGRVWVENNYSWESIADIYINVMTELINKSK
jgi:glycosyltransferase involved in cell wall biosynthesis